MPTAGFARAGAARALKRNMESVQAFERVTCGLPPTPLLGCYRNPFTPTDVSV